LLLVGANIGALLLLGGAEFLPVDYGGRVLDANGLPVSGLELHLYNGASLAGTAVTDSWGQFVVHGARRMDSRVVVDAAGYVPMTAPGWPQTLVVHRLPRLQGRAVDEIGGPAPGVLTLVRPGSTSVMKVETDDFGFFFIDAAPGTTSITVSVEAPNHDPVTQQLRLEQDHVIQFTPVLKRQTGALTINSDPSGQQPMIDGHPLPDCTTPCTVEIPIGLHKLTFENDLYVPWEGQTNLKRKGDRGTITATLERKKGTLAVSTPADGDLQVDGAHMGYGAWTGLVPTGDHLVTLRSSSYWPAWAGTHIDWRQTVNLTLSPAPIIPGDRDGFVRGLQAYLSAQGGQYGVYMQELDSGRELGYGDSNLLEAASVIKVPVAVYVYRQAEAGKFDLDDQIALQSSDFMGGTGTLNGSAQAGDKYSYRDLVSRMIRLSDNTAWKALLRTMTRDAVNAYTDTIGAPDCDQWTNNCNARQIGQVLAALARGRLLNADDTQELLGFLESTVFNDRINYYLKGATIAHKVGMDGGVINDAGIVYVDGDPFVIAVFTTTDNPSKGVQVIRDVARAASHYYGH
jgi:beta-lactamase class A